MSESEALAVFGSVCSLSGWTWELEHVAGDRTEVTVFGDSKRIWLTGPHTYRLHIENRAWGTSYDFVEHDLDKALAHGWRVITK